MIGSNAMFGPMAPAGHKLVCETRNVRSTDATRLAASSWVARRAIGRIRTGTSIRPRGLVPLRRD
jgi:hypothetical protein